MKVFAQTLNLPGGTTTGGTWQNGSTTIQGPQGFQLNTLADLITRLIPYFILFAGIGMLLMLVFGGLQLLTGANDPKQLEMGRKRITYSIIGFIVVFLAYWFVQALMIMFGLKEFACVFGSVGGVTCQ